MRTAILSCVHANLPALEVVLDDIRRQRIQRIVCLGDVVGYGAQPRECLKALMDSEISILGNHEEALMTYGKDFDPQAKANLDWTREQLNSPAYDRTESYDLWNFLGTMQWVVEEGDVMYTHGSPRIPTRDYVVPTDARNREKMQTIFDLMKRVCFVGHSHIPHVYTSDMSHASPEAVGGTVDLRTIGDRKVLINVGSVGQPRDGDPRASYVTFDGEVVRFHRLPYA